MPKSSGPRCRMGSVIRSMIEADSAYGSSVTKPVMPHMTEKAENPANSSLYHGPVRFPKDLEAGDIMTFRDVRPMKTRSIIGKPWWWLTGILALYLTLAGAADRTYMTWCDDAWFATPGINLATNGTFGTPVLDETAVWNARNLRGVNQRTYWFMPLHPVVVAGWTFIAGASLLAVRTLSMLWGLVALAAWFLIVRKFAEPDGMRPALFMAALLAIDFHFLVYAGYGRMDMMTEAYISSAF